MHVKIKEWVQRVEGKPIPILAQSVERLRKLSHHDDVPLVDIIAVIEQDPGLTVQIFRACNTKGKNKLQREITSVHQALMLLGIGPATKMAMQMPLINKTLAEPAHSQILRTFCRVYHASIQAVAWAKQRHDMTPDEVFVATQLHFLGEIVFALHAPEKLLEIFKLRTEENIASEEAQYIVLGFTLDQLSMALAQAWGLPSLVIDALHGENAQHPRAYGIMLAVQLARCAGTGWYHENILKVEHQAAEWLDKPVAEISSECHQLAVTVARNSHYSGMFHSAALLPLIIEESAATTQSSAKPRTAQHSADICLVPQVHVLRDTLDNLRQAVQQQVAIESLLQIGAQGMHDGIGLNRIIFATYQREDNLLHPKLTIGADNDPVFNRFEVRLTTGHLLFHLLEKPQAVCINDGNRNKYWQLVPADFQKLIGTDSFIAMSIFRGDQVYGLFYADRHTSACQIDNTSYAYFKTICGAISQGLNHINTNPNKSKAG
jgi:HD-like signal output (HDOD) protein